MGQALYRKYRSRSLDEIVGQKPVTTALENALKSGNISHAYLFTGPRGTGKTSIARILAFKINNIPYDSDNLPLDIIEIDAASNRRIDEIRDLRDKVNIAPVSAKYKVYIIDEVHMLTREAFNALLKTLEEPPEHVIFILATTEAHKLPETIISRTQRYTFHLASEQEVSEHLKHICQKEKITIDDQALDLLAKHSGGSLRDALSLLDQVRHSTDKINIDTVRQNLGLPSDDLVNTLLDAINSGVPSNAVNALDSAKASGATASLIAEQLLQSLRELIVKNNDELNAKNLELMQNLLLVQSSSRPDVQLELSIIGAQLAINPHTNQIVSAARYSSPMPALTTAPPKLDTHKTASTPNISSPDTKTSSPNIGLAKTNTTSIKTDIPTEKTTETMPSISDTSTDVVNEKANVDITNSKQFDEAVWQSTLETIRQDHSTLYSVLRMAKPSFDDANNMQIRLLFKFPFHQKRISEAHNKQCVLDCLATNGVNGYEIVCDVMPKDQAEQFAENYTFTPEKTPSQPESATINQIRSVFGGAEVLE